MTEALLNNLFHRLEENYAWVIISRSAATFFVFFFTAANAGIVAAYLGLIADKRPA